ncbi:MAG: transglutaminase domain-containing protein [bacterium]|nr:transglutaminase domain-containing protein [bacterium]
MVKNLIRKGAHKTLELAGLKYYQKPQKLRCGYTVVVKNISEKVGSYTVILPVPLESESQKIISQPEFRPEPDFVSDKAENNFALWKVELAPKHSASFNQYFEVERSPISVKINPAFTLDSYMGSKEGKKYLKKTQSLKSSKTRALAKEIVYGERVESTGEEKSLALLIPKIYEYVAKKLHYGDPIEGLYSVEDALGLERVDCGGFSTLFIAICQELGIPARLVSGFWAKQSDRVPSMHAWAESMLPDGSWVPADISTEILRKQGRSSKFASLGKIGSDRVVFSHGCDIELQADKKKIKTEILQNPIVIAENKSEQAHIEIEFSTKRET